LSHECIQEIEMSFKHPSLSIESAQPLHQWSRDPWPKPAARSGVFARRTRAPEQMRDDRVDVSAELSEEPRTSQRRSASSTGQHQRQASNRTSAIRGAASGTVDGHPNEPASAPGLGRTGRSPPHRPAPSPAGAGAYPRRCARAAARAASGGRPRWAASGPAAGPERASLFAGSPERARRVLRQTPPCR